MQHLQKTGGPLPSTFRNMPSFSHSGAHPFSLPIAFKACSHPCAIIGLAACASAKKATQIMTARTLDGQKIRDQIFAELSDEVRLLTAAGVRPGLAAVLVGENPASQLYVKSKIAACEELGLASWMPTPPASITTNEMLGLVRDLNNDDAVDGILIQLPLPKQVDTKRVLEAVAPEKDVDGFHPVSLGHLVSGRPGLVACTPAGCMEILRRNEIAIEGANAVVLGRSDIVGKPMALLLMHANATVTICHSKTRDLPDVVRRAD